jgi:flagellar hook protein FlgE
MFNNSGVSTIAATNGDTNGLGTGRRLGQMSGISISNDGRIYASYDNGMSRLLGQIAVAQFSNASGLEKDGDNLYKATQNSGEFDGIGVDVMSDGTEV